MDPALSSLLSRVVGYYAHTLANSPEARSTLAGLWGLEDAGLLDRFQIGYVDGTLATIMPRKGGEDVPGRLRELGILDGAGEETLKGCFTIPVLDEQGKEEVVQVAAMGPDRNLRRLVDHHKELAGWWNSAALKQSRVVTLVRDPFAGLLEMQAAAGHGGCAAVIAPGGPGSLKPDSNAAESLRLHQPHILVKADSAEAGWARSIADEIRALGLPVEIQGDLGDNLLPSRLDGSTPQAGSERIVEQSGSGRDGLLAVEFPRGIRIVLQGLRHESGRHLRAAVKALKVRPKKESGASLAGEPVPSKLHLDTLDLYQARSRLNFARTAAIVLGEDPGLVGEYLDRVVALAEEHLRRQAQALKLDEGFHGPAVVMLTDREKDDARKFLKDPGLLDRVQADLAALGFVGEESNKRIAYLASISRKLPREPLSVLVMSRSGAGKSTLADAVAGLAPPEDVLRLTRMTPQSLFYQRKDGLVHRLIVVEEDAGLEGAAYAVRALQSAGRLSLSSAAGSGHGLDRYGASTTREVRGPASVFVTTTRTTLDEETAGRFLVLAADESAEQTRRILQAQRHAEAVARLAGLDDREGATVRLHRNAQRLLQPMGVVNPYAPQLRFPEEGRLSARRDQKKYLGLIRAVALLHQHQREVLKVAEAEYEYVKVEIRDIEIANRLATEALGQSLADLSAPSRKLLLEILEWRVGGAADDEHHRRAEPFSQRALRERSGWRRAQLAHHVRELVQAEYLVPVMLAGPGRRVRYVLDWNGQGLDGERFIKGLKPASELRDPTQIADVDSDSSGSLPGHFRKGEIGREAPPRAPGRRNQLQGRKTSGAETRPRP